MLTVADIIALPVFDTIEQVTACKNPGRRLVRNVGILDCPPDYNNYEVYMPGEFIVTNMGYTNGDVDMMERSLIAMIERGVSAIAVKTVYDPKITDAVIEASVEHGVPVYLYSGAYHEMVAYQALDLIRRDELEANKNKEIDALLGQHSSDVTRISFSAFSKITGSRIRCIACTPKNPAHLSSFGLFEALDGALKSYVERRKEAESSYVCRYKGSFLAFVAGYGDDGLVVDVPLLSVWSGFAQMNVGVGSLVDLGDVDLTIRQALFSLSLAERHRSIVNWDNLGIEAFSYAARSDRLFSATCHARREAVHAYDVENGTDMLLTAKTYVELYRDVKATAEKLYQHPNTVRYRIRKVRSILGMDDIPDRAFERHLTLMFLDA